MVMYAVKANAEHQHTLGVSYHFSQFHTDVKNTYTFDAPAINYGLILGGQWAFTSNIALFIPVYGVENDRGLNISDYYTTRYGLDLAFGAARRFAFGERYEAALGPYVHFDWTEMSGKMGYANFRNISAGLGITNMLRWYPDAQVFKIPLVFALFFNWGADFIDLAHGGDLKIAWAINVGLAAGLRFR